MIRCYHEVSSIFPISSPQHPPCHDGAPHDLGHCPAIATARVHVVHAELVGHLLLAILVDLQQGTVEKEVEPLVVVKKVRVVTLLGGLADVVTVISVTCLLYTSDAADE